MDRGNFRDYRSAHGGKIAVPASPAPQPTHHGPARRTRRKPSIRLSKRRFLRPLIALVIVGLLVFFAYEYAHTKNQLEKLSNPKTATESATQQLINSVSKLMQLPNNETPVLASINNAASLRSQGGFARYFYANAQNGDKLLIYTKNNLGVIYRPSTNKIIASGPYDLSKLVQQSGTGQ